jgi:hypothetical protein
LIDYQIIYDLYWVYSMMNLMKFLNLYLNNILIALSLLVNPTLYDMLNKLDGNRIDLVEVSADLL